jgi:hypothetical protein
MRLLCAVAAVAFLHWWGLEGCMTWLHNTDKSLKAEYHRVDRILNPDREPLVAQPRVVKPRNEKPQPVPMKESYVER